MPESKAARLKGPEMSLAVLLTVLAGYIDAIGYLKLKGIYVANMSGNSISVGLHAASAHWSIVITRLWPVFSYVLGLITARILVDLARTHGFRRTAAPPFLLEIACLFLFFRWHAGTQGILFAAAAMGIQAATISRFNGITVYTAFVTGSLVKFAEELSEWLIRSYTRREGAREHARAAIWFFGVWVAYLFGAGAGGAALEWAGNRAILAACAILLCITILDLFKPFDFSTVVK